MSESPSFQNLPQNVKYKILTYFYENDNNFGWSQMSCRDEDLRKLIILRGMRIISGHTLEHFSEV